MPRAPLRPCTQPGCGARVERGSRCPEHSGQAQPCRRAGCPGWSVYRGLCAFHLEAESLALDRRRGNAGDRGYGAAWRRLRAHALRRAPICSCGAKATEVDHIVRRREGGADEFENLQTLCKPCHSRKTAGEGNRSARGGRGG